MVNKKAVLIATIIAIIVLGGIFGFKLLQLNKDNINYISEDNNTKNITNTIKNSSNKESTENTSNTNSVSKNTSANNETNTTVSNKDDSDPENIAIELVKAKWGNINSNVYFDVEEEVLEGEYIISVRDNDTTTEIASYTVNIKNKTVTEN